jgi:hypothetical protein
MGICIRYVIILVGETVGFLSELFGRFCRKLSKMTTFRRILSLDDAGPRTEPSFRNLLLEIVWIETEYRAVGQAQMKRRLGTIGLNVPKCNQLFLGEAVHHKKARFLLLGPVISSTRRGGGCLHNPSKALRGGSEKS